MKAKKSYKKGGRMGLPKDISGMGRFGRKMKKLKPIGAKKIMTGEMMEAASDKARKLKDPSLRKTVAEVDKPKRKKRRRKFENGGKVKRTANVNLRGEGKKKEPVKNMVYVGPGKAKKDMPFVRGRSEGFGSEGNMVMTERGNFRRGPVGPDYGDYVNQEKAAKDRLRKVEKLKSKGPDVIGLAKKVKPGTIKKSSAKIPVPAKKKRRPRRK